MHISKENKLKGLSPSISAGVSSDLPSNMTDGDFSLNYTPPSTNLVASFGVITNVNYFAICATNMIGRTVRVFDGGSQIETTTVTRDNVLMFVFTQRSFNDLNFRITGGAGSPTVQHVSAGLAFEVPNGGETSGYARNWLTRPVKTRTMTNNQAAPVAALQSRMPIKGSLKLPDMTASFTQNEWQEFFDFIADGELFYINEDNAIFESSYVCFDPTFKAPTAHNLTRALNNASINFRCYNGL